MKLLVDTHYACFLPDCTTLESEICRRHGQALQALARRSGIVRGLLAWWIGRRFDFVITINHHPGSFWLIVLSGLSRVRRLILLEFMIYPDRMLKRLSLPVINRIILGPALRHSLVAAQVMLYEEPEYYAKLLGLTKSRFTPILLPLMGNEELEPIHAKTKSLVFSSGRAACDWDTLFQAAEGAGWELVVVCASQDRKHIEELNRNCHATILSEISAEEHAEWMRRAAVYVLSLCDRPVSSGQIRLRNAISSGTPTVATRVRGLRGYAVDGESALLVDPGNAAGLRERVNELLLHPETGLSLAKRAREFAASRTESGFADAIHDFVFEAAAKSFVRDGEGGVKELRKTENV